MLGAGRAPAWHASVRAGSAGVGFNLILARASASARAPARIASVSGTDGRVPPGRRHHPDYDREDRLRRRLQVPENATSSAPLRGIDWSAARDAVGLQVAVIVEETGEVLQSWARDAVSAQVTDSKGLRPRLPP